MSAIAGLCRTDAQPVSRREVERMVAALAHRGPGGSVTWSDRSAALGHTAPGVAVESRGETEPFVSTAGNVIVADARLDNRGELAAALGRPEWAHIGDAELILAVYERWDEKGVERLLGDFAFAIWDVAHQRLFCARDHVGVKPFYYHQAPWGFLFASEIKALLTSPMVPYRLNPLRVADHLVGLLDDPAITFYHDVYRLPAAHTLTVSRSGTRLRRYWSLDPSRELGLGSAEAYADAFRACFLEAVRCRLGGDAVGCLLSGGLDSSSITAAARDLGRSSGRGALHTFTAIFPDLPAADLRKIDERSFVDAVLAQGGLQPHYVRGDQLSPLGEVDRALWHFDEAFAAPNLYLHWELYRAARDAGARVLLDGIDGDTTVSHGLERLAGLAAGGKVVTLARELRALSQRHRAGVPDLLWRFAIRPLLGRFGGRSSAYPAGSLIRPEFAQQMGMADRLEAFARDRETPVAAPRAVHARAMRSGLVPYALELADKAAAAFGIEPRYPFFDRRLMELCLAMPTDQKLAGGWSRVVMRRALGGLLPEPIRWRSSKANLAPNFVRQLLSNDQHLLTEVILKQPGALEDYVDTAALRRVYDRYLAHPTSETDALTVYGAVVLGLWLQRAKIS